MAIEVDTVPPEELIDELKGLEHVINAMLIRRV
jgi:hypothetical protein